MAGIGLFLLAGLLCLAWARVTKLRGFSGDETFRSLVVKTDPKLAADPATANRKPTLSRLPPDVVRDYSYNAAHLMNGAGTPLYVADARYTTFLTRLKQFPPDVLIVGKEAPFTHSLGPILSFGGENRTFPAIINHKNEDGRRQLSPDELKLRIKATERFVQDVHAAGARTVIPYISPMTMFGDADQRRGFFQFFDSWDQYAKEFDLGPKLRGNPLDWTQRDKRGENYFRVGGGAEDTTGMVRYSMCINNPEWRRWQMLVTDWIARVGFDGLWMDNVLVHRCYDQYCEAVAKEMGTDLNRDADRVWLESYLRYFDELRRTGSSRRHTDFYLGGNYIELPFQRAVTDKLDLTMVEQVWLGAARMLWPGGVWTGYYPPMPNQKVLANRTTGTIAAQVFNNLWLAQMAYAMRGDKGVHFLAGAAVGKGPEFAHNIDSAVLALAEAGTFGGGEAVQVVGQYPYNSDSDLPAHAARERFFKFARAHSDLYQQMLPAGDVAIIVFPDQEPAALVEAQQVHDALLWRGLLVDVLDGDKQDAATLARYALLIVPGRPDVPQWMKRLSLVESPDPLAPKEVTDFKKAYQKDRQTATLRHTKLSELALERAGALKALSLPKDSLVEGCAWSNDQRMVLHLLNYRVPIGLNNGGKVTATGEIAAQLKLPKGKRVQQIRAFSVDEGAARTVPFTQSGDTVKFKIASVRVYEAYELDF
jgi:hypothetical protein